MYKCWAKDHFIVVIQVSFNNRTPNEVASRKKIKRKNLNGEKEMCYTKRCRRALCWNSMWRNLQRHEAIGLGGEVNWLIDGPCGERLPAIDLAHVDLTGGEQGPEQHGGSLC